MYTFKYIYIMYIIQTIGVITSPNKTHYVILYEHLKSKMIVYNK